MRRATASALVIGNAYNINRDVATNTRAGTMLAAGSGQQQQRRPCNLLFVSVSVVLRRNLRKLLLPILKVVTSSQGFRSARVISCVHSRKISERASP